MQLDDRIGRRLKLRDLNILLAVVKERSMSKAAAGLAISQPAVSKAIADMEHLLGAPLLDRTPQGIEPTSYGQALIKRSLAVFDELRQSVKDIESLLDPSVGEVRIGCASPLAAGIVATVVQKLRSHYRGIRFYVVDGDLSELQQELRDRNIEIAIGRAQGPIHDQNLQAEHLFDDRLLVVAGLKNKWLRQRNIKLGDLLNEPWIFPHGNVAASLIANAFRAAGVDAPEPAVSSRSPRLNDILLASGRFLTVYPESMIRLSTQHMRFKAVPVDLPNPRTPVVIVTLKNRVLSPVTRQFIDTARDVARSLMERPD